MAKWESELKKVVSRGAANKKIVDDKMLQYAKAIAAAQAFIGAHAKFGPKIAKGLAELRDANEDCGRAAKELIVYEKDLDKAKKDKDKAKMKEIEAKMKPLIKTFETATKEWSKAGGDIEKAVQEIGKSAHALNAAMAA